MTADVSLLVLAVVSVAQFVLTLIATLTRPKTDPSITAFIRELPNLCINLTRPEYAAQYRRATPREPDEVRTTSGTWVPATEAARLKGIDLMNGEF